MAVASARLRASASAMATATAATTTTATTTTATATTEVFRRGLARVKGAFAVKWMFHLGGHGLVEQALDAAQQSAVFGAAE